MSTKEPSDSDKEVALDLFAKICQDTLTFWMEAGLTTGIALDVAQTLFAAGLKSGIKTGQVPKNTALIVLAELVCEIKSIQEPEDET